MPDWEIRQGDCLALMADMGPGSVDAVVTDPPYGLTKDGGKTGFMGAAWDGCVPGVPFWAEALRVAKPGAHLLAFGGTRTFHRLAVAVEDAGWEIRDTLSWLYGCLSEDTELLTADGWVHYHKATADSLALGYNVDKRTYEWMPIQEVLVYDYCDTAYHLHSDSTDQIVSRNHRCLVERGGEYVFQYAETLEQQARVPVLENLRGLLESLPLPNQGTGDAEPVLFAGLRAEDAVCAPNAEADGRPARHGANVLRRVRAGGMEAPGMAGAGGVASMFPTVRRGAARAGLGEARAQRAGLVDGGERGVFSPEDERREKPGVEGRRDEAQVAREPRGRDLRAVSGCVPEHGAGGRLRNGAQVDRSGGPWAVPDPLRGRTPQEPPIPGQPAGEPATVRQQLRPQTVRGEGHTRSDLVRVEPVPYAGKVWCIRVRSGAFVARRNGHVFVTGNSGFPKSHNGPWGGTALKPGWEPIVMARKPLRGTVAANHEAHGTGGLNIDGCRIGDSKDVPGTANSKGVNNGYEGGWGDRKPWHGGMDPHLGRWPANVCLDHEAAYLLDRQSGESSSTARTGKRSGKDAGVLGVFTGQDSVAMGHSDSGGASRFFYVAKPDRAERDMGILLPLVQGSAGNGRALDSAGALASAYAGTTQAERRNTHPTVKPVALMRWLCRLVTPPGGLILDPFCGSGTTGVAAVGEGFRFLGMELEPRFVEISRARIANTQLPLLRLHDLAPEEGATR